MSQWTFPHSTCESVNTWTKEHLNIAQPFSNVVNMMIAAHSIYYSTRCATVDGSFVFATFTFFELMHAYSHARHMNPMVQQTVIHILFWMFAKSLYDLTKPTMTCHKKIAVFYAAVVLDVVVFVGRFVPRAANNVADIVPVMTSLIMMIALAASANFTTQTCRLHAIRAIASVITVGVALGTEAFMCEDFLAVSNRIPYHLIVEFSAWRALAYTYAFVRSVEVELCSFRWHCRSVSSAPVASRSAWSLK